MSKQICFQNVYRLIQSKDSKINATQSKHIRRIKQKSSVIFPALHFGKTMILEIHDVDLDIEEKTSIDYCSYPFHVFQVRDKFAV